MPYRKLGRLVGSHTKIRKKIGRWDVVIVKNHCEIIENYDEALRNPMWNHKSSHQAKYTNMPPKVVSCKKMRT